MTKHRPTASARSAHEPNQHTTTTRELLAITQAVSGRMDALNGIAAVINRSLELDDVLAAITAETRQLIDFDHLSICLRMDNRWNIRTLSSEPIEADASAFDKDDPILVGLTTRRPQVYTEPLRRGALKQYGSIMVIPLELEADRQMIGTIQFALIAPQGYNAEDARFATLLALQLATAIRNAERFRAMRAGQESLAKYAIELEERNQELDAYSYTIAHDLKAPLNIVYGYTHMLELSEGLTADDQTYLKQIANASMVMSRMIEQLLFAARLKNQNEVLTMVDMPPVIAAAVERYHTVIREAQIAVEVQPDMPSACGHAPWLEEVFANLIGNAIKYIGRETNDSPCIRISGALRNDRVRYAVIDNGIGIDAADQARLFEQFTRLNTLKADGSGLGLSIVQRIITRLNGEVGIDSTAGVGSTFWFTLPASCG